MATRQVFNGLVNFYSTQLYLEQGKRDVLNTTANLFLYGVQILVGQRIVWKNGKNFAEGTVSQPVWYQTVIKVTLFIAFYRITVPILATTAAIGTLARLVSLRSPEIRQGIFNPPPHYPIEPSIDPDKILEEVDQAFLQFLQTTNATNPLKAFLENSVSQIPLLGPVVAQTLVKISDFAPNGMHLVQFGLKQALKMKIGDTPNQQLQEFNRFLEALLIQPETSLESWLKQERECKCSDCLTAPFFSIRISFRVHTSNHFACRMATSWLMRQDLLQKFIKNHNACYSKLQRLNLLNYWNKVPESLLSSTTEKLTKHIQFFEEFLAIAKDKPKAEVISWLDGQYLSHKPRLPFARADLFYETFLPLPLPHCTLLREGLERQNPSLVEKHKELWERSKRKLQQLDLTDLPAVQIYPFQLLSSLASASFSDIL